MLSNLEMIRSIVQATRQQYTDDLSGARARFRDVLNKNCVIVAMQKHGQDAVYQETMYALWVKTNSALAGVGDWEGAMTTLQVLSDEALDTMSKLAYAGDDALATHVNIIQQRAISEYLTELDRLRDVARMLSETPAA